MRLLGRPVPAAALTALLAAPLVLALVLVTTPADVPQPVDSYVFGPAGAALLTGHWSAVFASPIVQAGPFELAPFGIADLLHVHGRPEWTAFVTVASTLTAFVVALALRTGAGLRSSALAAAGTLVLTGCGPVTTWTLGHPSEVLVPVCWALAARLAIGDRPMAAAAVIAASTGFEVWGVLGAPILLLAPRPRLVRSAAAAVAVLLPLWVPLVSAGPFHMFGYRWPVTDDSLLRLIDPAATVFPWPLRLAQAAVAVITGAVAALLLRRRAPGVGVWLVPAVTVAARLVLDPMPSDYYWSPVAVCAVGLLVFAAAARALPLAALAGALVLATSSIAPPVPRALAAVVLGLGCAVVLRRAPMPAAAASDRLPARR